MVEFSVPVPGALTLIDHAIFRTDKGAVGFLKASLLRGSGGLVASGGKKDGMRGVPPLPQDAWLAGALPNRAACLHPTPPHHTAAPPCHAARPACPRPRQVRPSGEDKRRDICEWGRVCALRVPGTALRCRLHLHLGHALLLRATTSPLRGGLQAAAASGAELCVWAGWSPPRHCTPPLGKLGRPLSPAPPCRTLARSRLCRAAQPLPRLQDAQLTAGGSRPLFSSALLTSCSSVQQPAAHCGRGCTARCLRLRLHSPAPFARPALSRTRCQCA